MGECTQFSIYHLMDLVQGEEGLVGCVEHGVKEPNETDINGFADRPINNVSIKSLKGIHPLFGQRITLIGEAKPGAETVTESKRLDAGEGSGPAVCMALPARLTLGDIAKVVRSKNSGPFEITFDVMFEREQVYNAIKNAGILGKHDIANMFAIKSEEVVWCGFFDQARAFKATIPRRRNGKNVAAGGFLENDVHGSQQYMPLMKMVLPEALARELRSITE